jgi:hypothetical protein
MKQRFACCGVLMGVSLGVAPGPDSPLIEEAIVNKEIQK